MACLLVYSHCCIERLSYGLLRRFVTQGVPSHLGAHWRTFLAASVASKKGFNGTCCVTTGERSESTPGKPCGVRASSASLSSFTRSTVRHHCVSSVGLLRGSFWSLATTLGVPTIFGSHQNWKSPPFTQSKLRPTLLPSEENSFRHSSSAQLRFRSTIAGLNSCVSTNGPTESGNLRPLTNLWICFGQTSTCRASRWNQVTIEDSICSS